MNARIDRRRLQSRIVVYHRWEPEPSAAYAELDRTISVGLAELVSRMGNGDEHASPAAENDEGLPYLRLLGRVIELQSQAVEKPDTWLGHLVAFVRQWIGSSEPSVDKENVVGKLAIAGSSNRNRIGTRASVNFRR